MLAYCLFDLCIGTNFSEIIIEVFQNVECKMAAILSRPQRVNTKRTYIYVCVCVFSPPGAESEIFWANKVNTMAADAMTACVTRSSPWCKIKGSLFSHYLRNLDIQKKYRKCIHIFLFPQLNSAWQGLVNWGLNIRVNILQATFSNA